MIAAIVLAAGSSRRFGSQKLVVPVGGMPLVRASTSRIISLAQPSETIVVVDVGAPEVRRALDGLAVRVVENRDNSGMGSSIACGVRALPPAVDGVLIVPGDTPKLTEDAVRRVLDERAASRKSIVAPSYRGVPGHPVLFAREIFDELKALTGDRGAREVVERDPSRVARLELGSDAPRDVDSRDDLALLEKEPPADASPAAGRVARSP